MTRFVRHVEVGAEPGALKPGPKKVDDVTIDVLTYSADNCHEAKVETIGEALQALRDSKDYDQIVWLNITGLHDVEILTELRDHFDLHRLAMEDVVNVGQRPKVEFFPNQVFIIMRMLSFVGGSLRPEDREEQRIEVEQFSLFFGKSVVVTLQEKENDPFDGVRERIRRGTGNIRHRGADYLAYALVDALTDSLYPILEAYGEWIDVLERQLIHNSSPEQIETVQGIKRDLLWMRRCAWPHREVMSALERPDASDLIAEDTRPYFRDCYEHSIQLMDVVETFRDLAGGLTDLYLSSASNRMNEVMKVLTIISSIFIPMTFVAGIYGMNFNPDQSVWNMPELNWVFGYPAALGTMVGIALVMIAIFRRKHWL